MSAASRAHNAVSKAIKKGEVLPVSEQRCAKCGAQATEYHHHNGYAKRYWLDVMPLCGGCHWLEHVETSRCTLTDNDVRQARKMRKDGMTVKEIANYFNYDPGNMSGILLGRSYKWVK